MERLVGHIKAGRVVREKPTSACHEIVLAGYMLAQEAHSKLQKRPPRVAHALDVVGMLILTEIALQVFFGLGDPSSRAFQSQTTLVWGKIAIPILIAVWFIMKVWLILL